MQLPHSAVLPLRLRDPRLARPIAAATPLASVEDAQAPAPTFGGQGPKSDYRASYLLHVRAPECMSILQVVHAFTSP